MYARLYSLMRGLCVLGLICATAPAAAGEKEDKGREVFEKYRKAVVTVQLVLKQKFSMPGMGSREDESKEEATGVIIDPSGLTVMSLSETDPSSVYEKMLAGVGEDADRFKMTTTLSDVRILLDGGSELPAKVVLRDKDLDLAFLRPTEPPADPLTAVDLTQDAKPEILEPLLAINRLGKVVGRTHAAGFERVNAIVRKPRTFYVPGNDPTHSGLGSPVFTLDGQVVGILVLRTIKTSGGGRGGMFGSMGEGMTGIIVPAEDILEVAGQAPAAEDVEEKQETEAE